MKRTLYVMSSGQLRRQQNTLRLELKDGRKYFPIEQILEIHLFGTVTLNTKLMEFLSRKEILLHVYNHYGYYMGTFYPREHYNSGYMTLKQAEHYLDSEKRFNLARRFVDGSIANLMSVLRYYDRRGYSQQLHPILQAIDRQKSRLREIKSIEELMQAEGQAREAYYQAFDAILNDQDFAFQQRTRRPPANRLNALISFGNSLLYTVVLSEIYKTHLDPRIGFLHATNFRRFTLNLDVAEIFKPLLVDRLILSLIQKQQIKAKHFEQALGGLYLAEEGRKIFVQAWEAKLGKTLYHRALGRKVSYRRLVRLELYKLQKHLLGEREYVPYRTRW